MEQVLGSSMGIQKAMRLGSEIDVYYYNSKTLSKQAIPTIVDTRFYQELTSLGAGSSTFIISVDQGISDIILSAKLPAHNISANINYIGMALPRGWLYHLINRVSVRYGSSSQYFWTGSQILLENLREMPNPSTRDNLYELGGANMTTLAQFAGDNLFAYAYLNLPHNSPNGSMAKPNPFPSELIAQPIVITLELNPLQSIFSSNDGSVNDAPSSLESAYFQVKQIHAKDAGELMSMPGGKGSAYSLPLKAFYQNQVDIQVGTLTPLAQVVAGAVKYDLQLTGFRNGEVRSIFFWITKERDINPTIVASTAFVKNFDNFILPKEVELLYNGTVYYRAKGASSQMWSLVSTETPPLLQCTVLSVTGAGAGATIISTPRVANWTEIPFAQVFEQLSGAHMYVAGKLIQNAVVNLSLELPDTDRYRISLCYSYNSSLMFSDKACEYVF